MLRFGFGTYFKETVQKLVHTFSLSYLSTVQHLLKSVKRLRMSNVWKKWGSKHLSLSNDVQLQSLNRFARFLCSTIQWEVVNRTLNSNSNYRPPLRLINTVFDKLTLISFSKRFFNTVLSQGNSFFFFKINLQGRLLKKTPCNFWYEIRYSQSSGWGWAAYWGKGFQISPTDFHVHLSNFHFDDCSNLYFELCFWDQASKLTVW